MIMIAFGILYTLVLLFVAFVGMKSDALFVALGFGAISLISMGTIIGYLYHISV